MAEVPCLTPFRHEHRFLRRIAYKNQISDKGIVHWRAFKDRDEQLSLTFQDESLQANDGLDRYRCYFATMYLHGDLPGICWLSFYAFVALLDPPLEPRHDPDPQEPEYGRLHCSTPRPDDRQMRLLAKFVRDGDQGALLRKFVPVSR